MTEFIAINKDVGVIKETVLSFMNSLAGGREFRPNKLKENGVDLETSEWFNRQKMLYAYKTIKDFLGEMNLFLMGKAIMVCNYPYPS